MWDTPLSASQPDVAKPGGDGVSWGDWGRTAYSGTVGFAAAIAGAFEYMGGPEGGQAAGAIREGLQAEAGYQVRRMGPEAQQAIGASLIPEDGEASAWDTPIRSLSLKAIQSLPSMVASTFPAAIVARGMMAAGATAGAVRAGAGTAVGATNFMTSGGDVFSSMAAEFGALSEDAKREGSAAYRMLRDTGMDDEEATRRTISEAAGLKPVFAGLLSAAAGYALTGRAIGDITTGATRGVLAGARQGAISEGIEETAQTGAEEIFGALGMRDATGKPLNYQQIIARTLEGGVLGGAMGGGMGAVGGAVGPGNTPAPDQEAGLLGSSISQQYGPQRGAPDPGTNTEEGARIQLEREIQNEADPEMRRRLEDFGRSTGLFPEQYGPPPPVDTGPMPGRAAPLPPSLDMPTDEDWHETAGGSPASAQRLLRDEIRNEQDPAMRRRLVEFAHASGIATDGIDLDEAASPMDGMAASQTSAPASEGQASRPGPNHPADDSYGPSTVSPVNNVAGEDLLAALGPVAPPSTNPQSSVASVVTPGVTSPEANATPLAPPAAGPSPAAPPSTPQAAPQVSAPEVAPLPKLTGPQQGALDLLERQAAVVARMEKVPEDLIDAVLADLRAELAPKVAGVRGGASEIAGDIVSRGLLRQYVQEAAIRRLDQQNAGDNFSASKDARAAAATGRNARRKDAEIRMDADWRTVRTRVAKLIAAGDTSPVYQEISAHKPGRGGPPAEKAAKIASLKERLAEHEAKVKANTTKAAARAKKDAPPTLAEILDGNQKPEGREKLDDFRARMARIVANAKQAGIGDPFVTRVAGMLAREGGISRVDMGLLEIAEFKTRAAADIAVLDASQKKLDSEVKTSAQERRATAEWQALGTAGKQKARAEWSEDAAAAKQAGQIDLNAVRKVKVENLIDVAKALPQRTLAQRAIMMRLLPNLESVRLFTVKAGDLRGADGLTTHRIGTGQPVVLIEEGLSQDRFIEVVLHEAVHAATQARFFRDPKLAARMEKLLLATIDAMGYSRTNVPYSLSNIDEFLAYAMTSESFQAELANTRLPEALAQELGVKRRLTLWDGFVELLRRAFGIVDFTALEAVIRLGGSGFTSQSKQAEMRAAAAVARNAPSDAAIQASVQSILASASSHAHDLTKRAPDMLRSADSKVRAVGLGFMTASDIVEVYRGLFNWTASARASSRVVGDNPLAQVQNALARQAVRGRELREAVEPIVRALNTFTKKAPREAAALNLLMQEATTFAVHPDVPLTDPKNKHLQGKARDLIQARQQHPRLAREYQRLAQAHPETIGMWEGMASYFEKSHQDMSTALIKNLLENRHFSAVREAQRAKTPLPSQPNFDALAARFMDNTATDQDKAWLGDTMAQHVKEVRRLAKVAGPYFPQRRFGDFVVQWEETAQDEHVFANEADADAFMGSSALVVRAVQKRSYDAAGKRLTADDLRDPNISVARTEQVVTVQNKGVEFFDTRGDAEARRRELNSGSKHQVSEVERRRDQPGVDLELVPQQLHALVRAIGKQDMPDDRIALTQKAIEQAAARLLPGTSAKSALLRRHNVKGASTDAVRATAAYANASSNYLAKLEYAPVVHSGLEGMENFIIENRYSGSEKTIARQEVLREMHARQRLDAIEVGTGGTTSRLVRTLQSLTFINFLVSPAYTMINLMQQVLVTAPYLGARFGDAETAKALASANSAIFGKVMMGGAKQFKDAVSGSGNITDFVAIVRDQISKGNASDKTDLLAMIKHLSDSGLIDLSAGMELARAGNPKITLAGKAIQYTEDLGRAFPAAAEVVNRAGSAIAAYRLARGPGKNGGMNHEAATEFALETVRKTQFDYTAANTARFMDARRSPFIALAMTFRKYAQGMYMLLGRSAYTAFKGASPQERSIARKTLTRLMISHMVFAGALGLPLEPLKIAIGLVGFLFGADEPWDYEKEIRQGLASVFGVGTAEVLTRGLPRLIGADLSSRVGLDSMLFAKGLQDYTPQTIQNTAFELAGGAPASMLLQIPRAMEHVRQGQMMQAAEQMVPKGIRDVIKAARLGDEGLRTKRGEQIGPDLSGGDMLWQAIGIQPSRVAETYEARNAIKGAEREITTARTRLMKAYSDAEPGERQAIWSRIRDWNSDQNPQARVTMDQLVRSMQEQRRRGKDAQASPSGIYLPANRRYLQQEGSFANVR